MARTIESPGVEIREIDLTNVSTLPVGTNIFIQGFCATGPVNELVNITSISEFERLYGVPTNAAERYAYQSAKQVLQSPGRLIFNRLPYGSASGEGTGSEYTALAFPYVAVPTASADGGVFQQVSAVSMLSAESHWNIDFTESTQYQGLVLGSPTLLTMPTTAYESLKQGDINSVAGSNWPSTYNSASSNNITSLDTAHRAAFIVTNDFKTSIDDDYSGYYLAVTDNTNVDDVTYEKIQGVTTRNNGGFYSVPDASLTFNLTSTNSTESTSEIIETSFGFDFGGASYNDMVQFTLFRLRPDFTESTGGPGQSVLDQVLLASTVGSMDIDRTDTVLKPYDPVGTNVHINKTVEEYTRGYLTARANPSIGSIFAGKIFRTVENPDAFNEPSTTGNSLSSIGFSISGINLEELESINRQITALGDTRELFSIGEYEPCTDKDYKIIGNTVQKMERGFTLANNRDLVPLDIVCDAGLSTIEAVSNQISSGTVAPELGSKDIFDDTAFVSLSTLKNANAATARGDAAYTSWVSVFNALNTFCSDTRADCMCIVDPLRNIFVQGRDSKISANSSYSFSSDILVPMRNLVSSTNSNYAATYGNWVKALDVSTDTFNWYPFSGYQAGIMARVDSILQPWYPPAGLNNGVVRNIVDIAVAPNQRERDLLYRYGINPVADFVRDGFVVMGQKTLQAKPSAFDRINVRRLFLTLEKATRQVARYFVMELNTTFTRTRLVNVLTPIFENAKNNQGVYDYLIVCDERNNTPDVIDRNELAVDIYLKPTRAAEFILINFIATRTGDDFSEIVG